MAVNLARTAGLTTTTDLGEAGATFNDATRLLDGGLWNQPADNNNQLNYLTEFTQDINAVLSDVTADLAKGVGGHITIGGHAYTLTSTDITALKTVQQDLNTMLANAPNAVNPADVAAQQALHNADVAILNTINNDGGLAGQLHQAAFTASTGATDNPFQAIVQGSDSAAALAAATQTGASLAQVGAVFNAASDLAIGGLNSSNLGEFKTDMQAVATGLQNILNNHAELAAIEQGETATAAALTTIHLQTLENQAQWEIGTVIPEYANNPNVAARSTNDNLLDMIDIVNNDANLSLNAGGGGNPSHNGGFAEQPGFLTGTTLQFQDNQAETNFWAQFIAESNTINNQLNAVANGTSHMSISTLITEIQNFNSFGKTFAAGTTGIFGARFENELTQGTLLADSTNAVQGLQGILHGDTGAALAADKAQILAAAQGFVADAMDVGGNNLAIGGVAYVTTSTTVAGATATAGLAQGGTIPVGPTANPATGLATSTTTTTTTTHHEPAPTPVFDHHWG